MEKISVKMGKGRFVLFWRVVLLIISLSASFSFILSFQFLPNRYQINEADVAPQTIKSPRRLTFVSQILTREERERAASEAKDVYRYSPGTAVDQTKKAREALQRLTVVRESPTLSFSEKQSLLARVPELEFSPQAMTIVLGMDSTELGAVITETLRVLQGTTMERILPDGVAEIKTNLMNKINPQLGPEAMLIVSQAAGSFIKPNMVLDREGTEQAKRAAREAVNPVLVTLERGETILRDGEIIKPAHIEKLEAVGLLNPSIRWEDILGLTLLALVFSAVLVFSIYHYQPRMLTNGSQLLILFVILVATLVAAKMTIPGRDIYAYLFPLAVAPMLIATMLDVPTAVSAAIALSVFTGYLGSNSIELVTAQLVAGLVGLFLVRRAERLITFFIAGSGVAGASFAVILAFRLLTQNYDPTQLALYAFVSLVNGGLAAILTMGVFTLLGHLFGLTTPLHLLELAHPNQPLLRRLLREAPGTYHHSLVVANLAEQAAERIGADSLLVRVGAYYHDIGKVLRPGFFVENQMDGENLHEGMDSSASASIIAAHVEDGLKLAEKHRLPHRLKDFIAEHHGTRLVTFFYHQACQEVGEVDSKDYRYAGPRPRSKETGVLMLADAAEAAVRSARAHSPEAIDEIIDRVVRERLMEGQLDDCDLTFRELEQIKVTFRAVLQGVYHPRIEYPTSPLIENGRSKATL